MLKYSDGSVFRVRACCGGRGTSPRAALLPGQGVTAAEMRWVSPALPGGETFLALCLGESETRSLSPLPGRTRTVEIPKFHVAKYGVLRSSSWWASIFFFS